MPSNDSSCEPLNLYNIWKVKRESFGEIMSNIIDITNDSDSDSDSHTDSPQKEKSLYKLLTVSGLALKSVNDDFAPSKQISQYKTLEDKNTFKKENDSNKKIFPKVELVQKIKGSHPRLAYLGKSRYFTSLREIYLPLIEMCKSSSWEQKSIDEVLKHVKNMTRELYVAMCDPSVDAYFSTMYFRDNQIIDSCSDVSELKLEYNIFSPKKWRDKEIYVDLRRGIALIKVLCDLDPKCMEVILNSALNKLPCELPMKPPQKTAFVKGKDSSCCSRNIMKQPSTAGKKQFKKDLNEKNKKEVKLDKEMEYPPQESAKRDDGNDNECHLEKISKVRKKKRMGNKQPRQYSHAIDPAEPWSWIFVEEGLPSVPGNKYHMNLDLDEALPNVNITIAYEDDRCKEKMASGYLQPTVKLSCENSDEVKLSGNQPTKTCVNKDRSSLKIKQMYVNPSASDMNPVVHKEVKLIPRQFEESSHKTHESSKLMENLEEKVNIELFDLDKKEGTNQLSILDSTIKNDHQGWVEAIESPLLTINEKSSTKQIIALRDNACCSKAEKEFLTYALSTFSKIKSNMKSGYSNEEDKGKKRKFSEDSTGHSKKLALDVLYAKDEVNEGSFITIEAVGKLISENIKPTGSSFSFKKKRDVRPLRKSIKDDAIPGTSKNEPNLDQEIEMEIQKIFNEPLDPKPNEKKKGKAKEIDSFNCDDLVKTDRLNYFINLAHSGDFLVLLFELIREIGRKIYTTNFNYLFAVVINLIHTLLKNGNPGLIQRNFLFDILQEILYCRPSPVALLQMNKLLVDVIPFQPFLTSLMCHNANSNHMIIDIEPVFFTRGACFIEVISSLIDYFMNDSDWEIQTYCVRWLSYMYLIEKTTIEEWYLTQKTVCRRCHCLVLLTSMAVKIFETASSYYLRCCIENRLTYLLSCQLLEIIQSGVKILYVMIDFDKYFSENIGDRYGMFLRFLDTVKLIHRSPEQFKEFNTNNEDFDIVQLLLIEEKVVDSIAKASKTTETINEMANLFNTQTDWPPKSFQGDRLFFSELSD
nr:uncharacterized protein LOC106687155 [Halyomorpha halys]XP_024218853.1 uncharacterized protein LOC106687155 [Halyomorpha halys]